MGSSADEPGRTFVFSFGLEKLGLLALKAPRFIAVLLAMLTVAAGIGVSKLKVDDSLSELFRTNTEEFHRYEEIDRRFPSSEYDVLVVVEGPELLQRKQLGAVAQLTTDLQLIDGVSGLVSMLSARGPPDASGYAAPIVPDELPEGAAYDGIVTALRSNDIVKGKFLSDDGQLAMIIVALDRKTVQEKTARVVIGEINSTVDETLKGTGLTAKLTGAPVMQLEIRNAVERDQIVYNGLGLLFGALIAAIFFRRVSLMLVAALPPVLAVTWSLGLLGWMGFRLNLFLNVMTPLIMVMGFSDSMQMVSAIRIRLREGDDRWQAVRFAVCIVGPACVLAHGTALLAFCALLLSESGLIRTFGLAGSISVFISFIAVILVLPILGVMLIRNEAQLAKDRTPADRLMDGLGTIVGCNRRSRRAAPLFLFAAGARPVCGVHGCFHRAAVALSPRGSGARSRAGARCDEPHRQEAHRRQSGARHDRVDRRRPRCSRRARSKSSRKCTTRSRKKPASATSGRLKACAAGCGQRATTRPRRCRSTWASCPSISCAASSPRKATRCW